RDCLLTLDYERREVSIESGALPAANGRDLLKLVGDARRPTIPIMIEGAEIRAVVDTGFKGFLRLPKEAITHTEEDVWLGRSTTVAGVSSKAYVPLEEPALLGGFRLHFPRFAMAGVDEGSPLIGSHILRRFRWTFDQRSRIVQVTPRGNESLEQLPTSPLAAFASPDQR
ncbi:MAG TPA: hypothetical protein PKA37_15935, partial [Planctomycetota bacterium]|nr:hypothetical protein [Planctomycetota bacterium]